MADIKTMTEEITDLNIDLEKSMIEGDYLEVVQILKKIIEKMDEVVAKINE
jgi:hypothetical protein